MKKTILGLTVALVLSGCKEPTATDRVNEQINEKVYSLSADERSQAQTNAKAFYEKEWPISQTEKARGTWTECRPSDSNSNGLVTCFGLLPNSGGGFREVKRYCGYTKKLVGCSDEDTVK